MATVDDAFLDRARPANPDGSIRWQFKLTVKPSSGRPFGASFAQDLPADATFNRPAHVLYDAEITLGS
jgi:hypothetical protein